MSGAIAQRPRQPISQAGFFLTIMIAVFAIVGLFHLIVLLCLTLMGEEDKPSLAETLSAIIRSPWHPLAGYSTIEAPSAAVYVLFVPLVLAIAGLAFWWLSRRGHKRQARETGGTLSEDVMPLHRDSALEYSRKILPEHVPDEERVIYLGKLM